jgi:hypothetical protein
MQRCGMDLENPQLPGRVWGKPADRWGKLVGCRAICGGTGPVSLSGVEPRRHLSTDPRTSSHEPRNNICTHQPEPRVPASATQLWKLDGMLIVWKPRKPDWLTSRRVTDSSPCPTTLHRRFSPFANPSMLMEIRHGPGSLDEPLGLELCRSGSSAELPGLPHTVHTSPSRAERAAGHSVRRPTSSHSAHLPRILGLLDSRAQKTPSSREILQLPRKYAAPTQAKATSRSGILHTPPSFGLQPHLPFPL